VGYAVVMGSQISARKNMENGKGSRQPLIRAKIRSTLKIIILAGLVLSMLPSQPGRAAGSWYVAPGGNDSYTCTDTTHPCATIQAAVDKAAWGDMIYVAVGTYTSNSSTGVLYLDKGLVVSGGWNANFSAQTGKSTLDGENSRRAIAIAYLPTSDNYFVTIEDFIIQHGYNANSGGAGIAISRAITTINDCIIQYNHSSEGAGISNSSDNVTINRSVVRGNIATSPGSGGGGGGIYTNGNLTLNDSVIYDNTVVGIAIGSAILGYGIVNINNSTISQNAGGGMAVYVGGNATINSSTIVENEGYGIEKQAGSVTLQNTILAHNTNTDCYSDSFYDYYGSFTSLGYNLIGNYQHCIIASTDILNANPNLGPLQDNGGPTFTNALNPGSQAMNAGNPDGCAGSAGLLTTDQRGFPRNGRCDIGAYEAQWTDFHAYLPVITNGNPKLIGHVTFKNAPAPGIPLDLLFFDGSSWSVAASTFTDWEGTYSFSPPPLVSGQAYSVRFVNNSVTYNDRLAVWYTRALTDFSVSTINIGDFDIVNVSLMDPTSGSVISLPQDFDWWARQPMELQYTDRFQLEIFDPSGGPADFKSPILGAWVTGYILNQLPTGFGTMLYYAWTVWVISPDGGSGLAYYYNLIAFSYSGSALQGLKDSEPIPNTSARDFLSPRWIP
jgi:hypothetical protein